VTTTIIDERLDASWHFGTAWRRVAWLAALATVLSMTFAWLILRLELVAIVPLIIWAVLIAVVWRPFAGLCVALFLVGLFELNVVDPFMAPATYIHYGLQSTLGLSGLIVSPLEMLLMVSLLVWLVQGITGTGLDFRGGHLGRLVLLFALMLGFGMIRGRFGGGILYIGFWELRPLLYVLVCYVLAANLVRTRLHVRMLIASLFFGVGVSSVEGAYRRVALIDTGLMATSMEGWYGHDTVIFLSALVVLIVAQQVFGCPGWQRALGLLLLPLAIFTMLATERRAGQVALIIALIGVFVVFLKAHRKAFFLVAVPVLVGGAVYLPLFWNATGVLAQPARAIRSISDPDPRDASSNQWREIEKINIRATIRAYPLRGVGFGQPFLQVVAVPDISALFPFWDFEPHHNLFWIWFKTGAIGYIVFWTLMGSTLAWAAFFAKTLRSRELRVFAVLVVGGIMSALTYCYVDLGLTMGRVTVLLGTLIGAVSVLDRIPTE
jgi:hypothetical protein